MKYKLNNIYNEDCLEAMKNIPDEYFDLIITSPPYNLGEKHHTGNKYFKSYNVYNDNLDELDYQKWQIEILNECYRILKKNGSMFYNHKNRIKKGIQISPYEWILKTNFITKQELVWFNRSQNFDKIRFYPMTERVYWLVKDSKTKLFNAINHHDLFEWKAVGTNEKHKRSFPTSMVEDLLKCFNKGIVLDIFMGSGTTAIACENLGFDYIGFEISKEYCDIANERINKQKAQMDIFNIGDE